jgi:hypothetical protein
MPEKSAIARLVARQGRQRRSFLVANDLHTAVAQWRQLRRAQELCPARMGLLIAIS